MFFALPVMLATTALAAQPANLVFDGDSIPAGAGASRGHGLADDVAAAMDPTVPTRNIAISGRPVRECLRLYDQRVAPLYDAANPANVIVFHAGDNDIAQGSSADQTYTAFSEYVARAHHQGWKVVVSTELRRADFPPMKEQTLLDYNDLLRRNQAGADAVVDLDTNPKFLDFKYRKDPDVFSPDGVHPDDGGYEILSDMLLPAVKRLAGQ